MRNRGKVAGLVLLASLCACSERPNSKPASSTSPTAAAERGQPSDPSFIGRVWISTTPGAARGSIIVFLPDRTLLMDSCFEGFRLSRWGAAGNTIRWREDSIPIQAEVEVPNRMELRLRIAGRDQEQTYVAASVPYVCPDMPR